MKNSCFVCGVAALMVFSACNDKPFVLEQIPGNEHRSSVVFTTAPNQENYLTDYFPSLEKFDSIVAGSGVTVNSYTDSTFFVTADAQLGTIDLWNRGKKLTLVVEDGSHFTSGYARLYTTWTRDNQVGIGFTQKPEKVLALWQNTLLPEANVTVNDDEIIVTLPMVPQGRKSRSYLRVYAATSASPMSDILVPLENGKVVISAEQLNRHDPETQILYSLMIDRFCNGKTENDWKINNPKEVLPQADYQGGDIVGITKKIQEGFFDNLSINTIWVSPITQNPYNAWGLNQKPRTRFSGYHGYWPIYITKVDERFGNDIELREMLRTAHEHNINVVLDYVANHLHIESPLFQAHPDWATDSLTADGRPNLELWDGEYRLTTWFDKHLPSLDLTRRDVADQLTDSALYWVRNFEFDGFRHDACKHIPLNYWRTFGKKLASDPNLKDRDIWMIGETYGSPELIGSYVKAGMLNAQFDFNIYHTAIDVFSNHDNRSMRDLARTIEESGAAYGAHNTMGIISGNHDKTRFISLAGGAVSWDEDPKLAGWSRDVGIGDSVRAYAKALLLEKLNLTLPGVPCIYQGDEYGQGGGNDPDNRRFMRFDGYNHFEQHNVDEVRKYTQQRRQNIALQFGDYLPLYVDDNTLVYLRTYMGEGVLVAINNADSAVDLDVNIPAGLKSAGAKKLHVEANDVVCEAL